MRRCDCGDASSDVSSTDLLSLGREGSQTFSRTRSTADDSDVEHINSEDEPILILPTDAKRAKLDMTELVRVLLFEARLPTWVWHVQHDVVQTLILTTHRVGCRSLQQMAKRCRHTLYKRIHSKAWHLMFDFVKFEGGATDVAKQEAGAFCSKSNGSLAGRYWPRSRSDACRFGATAVPCRKSDPRIFFTRQILH